MNRYGTAKRALQLSGVTSDSLGFETSAELAVFVEDRLDVASVMIEQDRNRAFTEADESIQRLVADIAERMVAGYLRAMQDQRNRNNLTVEGDSEDAPIGEPQMMTKSIYADLKRIPRTPVYSMAVSLGVGDAETAEEEE